MSYQYTNVANNSFSFVGRHDFNSLSSFVNICIICILVKLLFFHNHERFNDVSGGYGDF